MTSSTTGDRRWGTTRRSGMTILGKVAVPKPINLPSQRLENQGLDPNVEIVPKGTLSWGSKSPLNAWGTSSLSPRTESGPGSPSHLSNRPSSGGSVTRPSTADSDKAHDSSSTAWDSNSRPSSAPGVFPSNQASVALQRPHSADTRPGSSHLSRFAESVSETSATWGQHGDAPAKKDGFSLTSGDFPSLGTEKESTEKSAMPQDAGPGTRPASSSGRSAEERGVDCTQEANVRIGDDSAWRRDNQPYSENESRYCREEGQLDSRGLQPYPNANFPHQYDAWRGPPVNNHQGGSWYRGNQPYGPPMGPGGFHVDPFPFYPTQVPPVPGHEAGPRGNHAINEKMFRPPILDTYVHPRPGFYHGPVPREGYYGPPMGYGGPSNRDLPFAGRPAGPHAYHQHPGQGRYDTSASSVALERNEPSHSQERQYKILLKPQDGRLKEDEAKREEFLGNRPSTAEKVAPHMQTSKNNRRVNNNEKSGEVQPITVENAAREDPSLIQKIEGLNAKTTFNSETSANKVSARMPRSGHASDSQNSLPYKQVDPATNKSVELAAISGTTISRRSTQQTQGGADHQAKQRVNSGGNDGWRKTAVMSGSSAVTLAPNPERFAEINVGDSLDTDSIGKPGSGISVEPNDNQRTTMRELARQRTQQRQKEEEERARDQRAKALAKLEELNRRSQLAGESSVKNLEAAHNASTPDMPEVPLSHSPASREKKTTVTAEDSIEVTEDSGKTLLPSPEDANNEGSTQHDNPPRHQVALPQNRNAWVISRSKISYLRKTLGKLSISQEGTPCSPVTKPGSSVPSAGEKKDISKKSQAGKNPTGFADSKTSRHVPNSWGVGASFNECPFSGVNGSSPNPMNLNKYPLGVRHSKKGSNDDYWTSSLGVFHKGIQCDGCEVVPITGPRFKSKVKEDYDLCNNCFSVMGNEWDYTRMDEPVSVRHLHPFGGQRVPFSNPWLGPALPPHHGVSDFRSTWTKLDSRFVLDVNVIDGTVVAPSAAFTKIWKMRNNGSLVWPRGTQIFWIGGDRFSNSFAVDLQIPAEGVPINGELDVKVDFVAPELPGRYISYWMMASPIGVKFGQRVWVSINVDASLKGTDANEFHGLNLNAFPDETFAREFTGTNVNYEPAQTGSSSVNGTLKGADLEREAAGPQIPGNDDLLVGDVEPVVPNTLTPSSSSSSSLVGFRNMRTVEALGGGYSFTMDTPAPLQEDIEKNELETTMLKELEEMGFKEIDLNKEILKENEYNLEQSVEALCGVSEWDPILEELQEMGFSDEVTNKRLLKKNNGSIKDVVMDLLTGDKEA